MKFADPYILKHKEPKTKIIFAASQLQGTRDRQEDFFANFNDECFVIADGVGGMPHGDIASRLACETAIWAYKLVRLRRGYWKDKRLFIRRIFRTTNITLWQKHREHGFSQGLSTTLSACIVGVRTVWIGSVGDSRAYLFHNHKLTLLTHDDHDEQGHLTKVMGAMRYGLVPQYITKEFLAQDSLLLATDGVTNHISEKTITSTLTNAGSTTQSISDTVIDLLKTAEKAGSTDNMTAIIIKRVATGHDDAPNRPQGLGPART